MAKQNRQTIVAVMDDGGSVAGAVEAHGAITLDIDRYDEIKEAMPHIDGLVLTGGGDIKPAKYGQTDSHPRVYGHSFLRDRREFWAAKQARKLGIPLMGICRGHQMINVASGGSLIQHLPDLKSTGSHQGGKHPVIVNTLSQVGITMGSDGEIKEVITLHHQGIDQLGDGLVPVGWAPDGTIEMIESAPGMKGYVLGCQFHPEMNWDRDDDAYLIFMHFMRQVQRHASGKKRAGIRIKAVEHLTWTEKAKKASQYRHHWSGDSWPPSEATGWRRTQGGAWIRQDQVATPKSTQPTSSATPTDIVPKDKGDGGDTPKARGSGVLVTSDDDEEGLQRWLREKEATCSVERDDAADYTQYGRCADIVMIDGRKVPFWADTEDIKDLDENICGTPPCQAVEDCLLWGDCATKAVENLGYHPGGPKVTVEDVTTINDLVEDVKQHAEHLKEIAKGKRGNPRKKKGGG